MNKNKLQLFCNLMNNETIIIKPVMKRIDHEFTIRFIWEYSNDFSSNDKTIECQWEGYETMEELIDALINEFENKRWLKYQEIFEETISTNPFHYRAPRVEKWEEDIYGNKYKI